MYDYGKDFKETIHKFSGKYSVWQLWSDFLLLSAISMANLFPYPEKEKREEEYLSIIKKYEKEEQTLFTQLFALAVAAMEKNQEQDFLGNMYADLDLRQHQKGQFFTPYHISELMAELQCTDRNFNDEIEKKGYLSVNDPACGSGTMLIAFANSMKKLGLPFQEKALFVGQDIDRTAALMCFIQMSLMGCPAIIIIGDSLLHPGLHPDNEIWLTPFYHLNAWRFQKKPVARVENATEAIPEDDKEGAATALGNLVAETPSVYVETGLEYMEDTGGQYVLPLERAS